MAESMTIKEAGASKKGGANSSKTQSNQNKAVNPERKRWYKSVWFWIVVVAIIVLTAGLIWYFGFYRPAQVAAEAEKEAEEQIAEDWEDVRDEADQFASRVDRATSVEDFTNLSIESEQVEEAVEAAQDAYLAQNKVKSPEFGQLLDNMLVYTSALQVILEKNLDELTDTDFDAAEEASDDVDKAAGDFVDAERYIKDNLSKDFLNTYAVLQDLYDEYNTSIQEAEDAAAAEEKAAEEAAAQEAADKEDVTSVVNDFAEAYIDGNAVKLREAMTEGFEEEYNFGRLDDDYREYYAPVSFRVIEVVRNSDSRYYVYGRLTENYVETSETYSHDWDFTVTKENDTWLVDLNSAPSR